MKWLSSACTWTLEMSTMDTKYYVSDVGRPGKYNTGIRNARESWSTEKERKEKDNLASTLFYKYHLMIRAGVACWGVVASQETAALPYCVLWSILTACGLRGSILRPAKSLFSRDKACVGPSPMRTFPLKLTSGLARRSGEYLHLLGMYMFICCTWHKLLAKLTIILQDQMCNLEGNVSGKPRDKLSCQALTWIVSHQISHWGFFYLS